MAVFGYDCAIIPGASLEVPVAGRIGSELCGRNQGFGIATGTTTQQTVCSTRTPFQVRFVSDSFDTAAESSVGPNLGFQLTYTQSSDNC